MGRKALELVRGRGGSGRPYPQEQRARAVAYARQQMADGVGLHQAARELGVSATTLRKWSTAPTFLPVEVVTDDRGSHEACALTVHGPQGLRLDGVSLDTLVELWRRLS